MQQGCQRGFLLEWWAAEVLCCLPHGLLSPRAGAGLGSCPLLGWGVTTPPPGLI